MILLHRHPVTVGPARSPETPATGFPEATPEGLSLLLTADPLEGAEARGFSGLPAEQAWGNLLLQETSSLRIVPLEDLGEVELAQAALLVVPESCAGRLGAQEARLEAFARGGGVVVFERSWPGAGVEAGVTHPGTLSTTSLCDTAALAPFIEVGLDIPSGPVLPADSWEPLATAKVEGRGEHVLLGARRIGDGGYVGVAFSLARQLLAWQQGVPTENFEVPKRHREEAGVSFAQPNALVPDRRFLTTQFPHADAYERLLLAAVEHVRAVPRLWYFPYAYDGAYAMTHDEENFGDRSRSMTQEESRQGVASTLFVIPGRITPAGVAAMTKDGADLQLHWWRGWTEPILRPIGIWGWTPLRRIPSLAEQIERLHQRGVKRVSANRVHALWWDDHYTRDFRRLEAAGIVLDSTYGPNGPGQVGYLFGTGFPFHPLDTNGRPFRLLEVPFLFQDDESWSPELERSLLESSQSTFHQLIVPVYHVATMSWKPSVEVMEGWLTSYAAARAAGHWVATLDQVAAFWTARNRPLLTRTSQPGEYQTQGSPPEGLALMIPPGWRLDGSPPGVVLRRVHLQGRVYELATLADLGPRWRLVKTS